MVTRKAWFVKVFWRLLKSPEEEGEDLLQLRKKEVEDLFKKTEKEV